MQSVDLVRFQVVNTEGWTLLFTALGPAALRPLLRQPIDGTLFHCNNGFQQMLKMPLRVKEKKLDREALDRLSATLRDVPFLEDADLKRENARGNSRVAFVLGVHGAATDRRLVCEVKASGQPRIAREACLNLLDYTCSDDQDYPVFIAPYISPEASSICEGYGVGYLDLAGNCRLAFDQVYIRREGYPNAVVQKRDLRSLYSPKAERVLRVLLESGKRAWRMQKLADEAGVSLGQVANVKKLLADREWIETETGGLRLRSLDEAVSPILKEWAANYRPSRNSQIDFYSLKAIPQTEAELVEAGRKLKIRIAFTGFSGAARLAPTVRYQRITAYAAGDAEALAVRLNLKRVTSGANLTLIAPYDAGVFYGSSDVDGAPIVSPVQLWLDLKQTKGRGEEAAAAILEEVIKPKWR